ncbi:MAG: AraC family transcriptional regulator [Planctomycetia bacterium]|nr:AraC family transcriptional regulator [Planctomycetia bacterium]
MDASQLGRLPHQSWFGVAFGMGPATCVVHEERAVTHTVSLVTAGVFDVRWIRGGCESHVHHTKADVSFWCADQERHTRVIRSGAEPASLFMLRIPRRHLVDLARSDQFSPACANRLVDYIDARLHAHIGLDELATVAGLSPSHCARKFQRTLGLSLGRFVNRRRLAKALDVLRDNSTPLSRVALELGFSSQSHLTRLFSELFGITPARYRRQFKTTVG